MIHVLAHIEVRPGTRDDFLREFHGIVPEVLAEAGCLEYGPAVDAATPLERQDRNPNRVIVVEKWESVPHLEAHLVAPHMLAYRERVKDLVAGMSLIVVEPA